MAVKSFEERLDVFEAKMEESEKASSRLESNSGHLAASALPLSYNNRTTTSPHNPLCIYVCVGNFVQGSENLCVSSLCWTWLKTKMQK